jgi:CRP-like cAMP-binding protein
LPFVLKTVERQHYIARDRALTAYSSVLLSGIAVRSKVVGSGHRQILAIHIKGDLLDLQNSLLKVADHSVEMLTAGRVAMIPRADIIRLAFDRPAVGRAMWLDTLVEASIAREWLTNVGRRDARTRIAHLLCEFALRLEVAGVSAQAGYELPMTQEQIGDATGLTSVHVNRTIKGLEREGLIERPHPRAIQIGDWRMLAATGDFDSHYLHLRDNGGVLRRLQTMPDYALQ